MGLAIGPSMFQRMAEAARMCFPEECCGILIGRTHGGDARVVRVVHAANVACASERRQRFEIDPAALFAVQRELRGGGERVLGYFHSHPFGPLRPSAADLAGAAEVGLAVVIVVPEGRTGRAAAGAWLRLGEGRARRFRPLAMR